MYGGILAYQVLHHIFFYLRLSLRKAHQVAADPNKSVSVIVCARNEEENLKALIPLLLEQDYPGFEVIVVDDNSEDGTVEYLYHLTAEDPRVRSVKVGNVNKPMAGKKFPLTLGIKAAKHPYVLLTDADCRPVSKHWITEMMAGYANQADFVLGYSPYAKHKGWLNRIIRYETFFAGQNYLSYTLAGLPYMGVGRNLSYTTALFFRHGGFADHRTLPSGDDDLFINKVAGKSKAAVVTSPYSFMLSAPKTTTEDWKEQKTRHLSTARYYQPSHRLLLTLQPFTHTLVWLMLPIVVWQSPVMWWYVAGAFLFRWLVNRIIFTINMRKLGESDLVPYIELFDMLQVFYYFRFMKAAVVKTKYRWN